MSNKMLIDASHPEETRVVVTKGSRIEEFDFESEHKKQLKGNIYLARVTRVEPSLQAAFVEYGGNRHGFLAFSEIHPDYYQIPQADRQALLEAEHHGAEEDEDERGAESEKGGSRKKSRSRRSKAARAAAASDSVSDAGEDEEDDAEEKPVDLIGAEDALEEVPARDMRPRGASWRDYKIQEVIKRRQILLVQIVKEERGNKGAALTTYLSLAGRYSVLMPNTARGGGISRKITDASDRKRLKEIVKGLAVPRGMGIILRTAGAARTKTEVRRDYEYLMRLWENVRALTLTSIAPALVYEEGSLIKRSIRDLYNKDIDEILVSGEKSYREAKDFMRMLMPSHAKYVQPYREPAPIFARNGIEAQLDGMLQPEVGLKSGGYLVINQTEALVAIDVNSGRSTREHSVEETALQTNLEAAEEVARQLRLRDLAGLVVIDFIDMQEKRNIRAVEKKLKDCLRDDRARIQLGRISHFGLMEMSRQRIRASVLESTTQPCPHCFGTGYVRSQSSLALHLLRMAEEYLQRSGSHNIMVRTPVSTALYVLNHKRRALTELEERFGLTIDIEADDTIGKEHLAIHKTSEAAPKQDLASDGQQPVSPVPAAPEWEEEEEAKAEKKVAAPRGRRRSGDKAKTERGSEDFAETPPRKLQDASGEDEPKRRRRRGRRGGRRNRELHGERRIPPAEPVGPFAAEFKAAAYSGHSSAAKTEPENASAAEDAAHAAKPRGGRKPERNRGEQAAKAEVSAASAAVKSETGTDLEQEADSFGQNRKRRGKAAPNRRRKNDENAEKADRPITAAAAEAVQTGGGASAAEAGIQASEPVITSSSDEGESKNTAKKKGWWGRRSFF